MKQGLLNILSELMERKLFSYIPIFEAELERMLRPYDVFEKKYRGNFKEDECLSSNKGKQSKEIERFIQSLQVLENPQLTSLLNCVFSNIKNL